MRATECRTGRPIKDGDLTVWARHLSDQSVAVALYNEVVNGTLVRLFTLVAG